MSGRCILEGCYADITCSLGHLNRADCEHWSEDESGDKAPNEGVVKHPSDIPWNGYSLGTDDLAILGGRGKPLVLGMVGPPDSGKTSLLAFFYMWLLKHGELKNMIFHGSWTLGGWESVVQYSRWSGEPPPSFPPHTSSSGRHPGVLHVSFRDSLGHFQDVLFTDAPGEWFTQWARVPGSHSASGARWVIDHADSLLILIDSAALEDPKKLPSTRRVTRDLLERVGAEASHVPLNVVWTKKDKNVPNSVRVTLERACSEFVPQAQILSTTIQDPKTIAECFENAVLVANKQRVQVFTPEPIMSQDPFLAFRGNYVK